MLGIERKDNLVLDGNSDATSLATSNTLKVKQGNQYKKYDFTYNNYEKTEIERLERLFRVSCVRFCFQEEMESTPHLQGCIWLKERKRITELIDLFGKGISWRNARNWSALVLYCQDILKRIDDGIVINYRCKKPRKEIKILSQLYRWEQMIIDIITKEPNDRTIHWFWERVGNTGKSTFCKYLCVKYNAIILSGKSHDMKYGIVKYMEKNGDYPELIVLDVPRSLLDFISYKGIEEVKNGLFFSGKYEGDMVVGNCPHLLIFANESPDLSKLSADRWSVCEIKMDDELEFDEI